MPKIMATKTMAGLPGLAVHLHLCTVSCPTLLGITGMNQNVRTKTKPYQASVGMIIGAILERLGMFTFV